VKCSQNYRYPSLYPKYAVGIYAPNRTVKSKD